MRSQSTLLFTSSSTLMPAQLYPSRLTALNFRILISSASNNPPNPPYNPRFR